MNSTDNNIFERFSFQSNNTKTNIQSPLFSGLKKKETSTFQPTTHTSIDSKKSDHVSKTDHNIETDNVLKTDHNFEPDHKPETVQNTETNRFVLPRGYNKQVLEMFAFKPKV